MDVMLVVITLGSFVASFVNAAFATGGIYIMLAAGTAVLPIAAAVPLQPAFVYSSLLARVVYFWSHINWPIALTFTLGSGIGVYFGARVFVNLPEDSISLLLGAFLLTLIWMPKFNWRLPLKHPFFLVGGIHSFMGTLFGVGALLQSVMLRSSLIKLQITSTMAACFITMEGLKIIGYAMHGFDYSEYIPHIILASIAGFAGTWAGKRVTHLISEQTFRFVFKWLITIMALRLLYRGLMM